MSGHMAYYERQLFTYPRSDCSHLPEEHHQRGPRGVLYLTPRAARGSTRSMLDSRSSRDHQREHGARLNDQTSQSHG